MTKPLSPTQEQILTSAAQHPAQLAEAPPNLPAAARNAVFRSLIRTGLLEEVPGDEGAVLRITVAGLAAVAAPGAAEQAQEATAGPQEARKSQPACTAALQSQEEPRDPAVPQPRTSLRDAVAALLAAWDAGLERARPCPPQ